mmetsp:Transcript_2595/g.7245  ORF Transcript_2595/g.7245 Transcript_2595/m.7245 type:complete len:99 (-) Transcript_2595:981-1277(-)
MHSLRRHRGRILGPGYVPEDCKQGNMGDNLIWRFAQVMVFAADVTMPISIVALVWWMWTSPPQESCEELREDCEYHQYRALAYAMWTFNVFNFHFFLS